MKKSNKASKQENTTTKEDLLTWLTVKDLRLRLFHNIWKRWHQDTSYSIMPLILKELGSDMDPTNFQLAAEIYKIYNAGRAMGREDVTIKVAYYIHCRYWERIKAYTLKKVKLLQPVTWPCLTPTQTIQELILRGWVHESEVPKTFNTQEVILRCHIAPLVWPQTYYQHLDALAQSAKVGIPCRTGTKLPKHK